MDYRKTCEELLREAGKQKPVLVAIAESHKETSHERAIQAAIIAALPPGMPVIIEEGSFNNSLEAVAAMARTRDDLPVRYAAPPEDSAPASLADAFVFDRSRAIYEAGRDVLAQGHDLVVVFCGAGHLQGIARAAKKNGVGCLLVNTADVMSHQEKAAMRHFLRDTFDEAQQPQAVREIGKIMATVTFAYDEKKVRQLRRP